MFFSRSMIALDIGSSSVKVIECGGGKRRTVKAIGLSVLPPNLVIDGEIKDVAALTEIIQELFAKQGINPKNRRCFVSLGGSSVLIKRALITPGGEQDLGEQVFYEAQQLFQHDMDDMYFRYQEIPSQLAGKTQKAMVFVGAKRELVEQHMSVVQNLNMRVGVIDCDVFCIANMFDHSHAVNDQMVVNVHIGAGATRVILTYNGEFLYSREFFIGGHEYTQRIAQAMGVDFQNAETVKISAAGGDQAVPTHVYQVINEMNDGLVNEVMTTLNFFGQSEDVSQDHKKPGTIFLSGGGARTLGLDAALAASLQVPVQIVNPFQRLDVSGSKFRMEQLLTQGPLYAVACGLTLRTFNEAEVAA